MHCHGNHLRAVILLGCALLALGATGAVELRLGQHSFDWSTVEQDRAHFEWSAEVINAAAAEVAVKVTVDLLDGDDAIVHSDSTTTSLTAGQSRTVRHEGSLPFDRAADVVSFRFRLEPVPSGRS